MKKMQMAASEKQPLFIGLGEVLFDCLPEGPRLGGAPANFAWVARELGMNGMAVSAVGTDEMGEEAVRQLREKGLPCVLSRVPAQTGQVNVVLHNGIPSYLFSDNPAYGCIPLSEEVLSWAAKADVVCFGTLAQFWPVTRKTVRAFLEQMRPEALRIFDVNLRGNFYSRELVTELIGCSDVVKCNEDELPILSDYAGVAERPEIYADYLFGKGVSCFIYTEGSRGSTIYTPEEVSHQASPRVSVVDTVGAGDSFTAAFISAMARGCSLKKSHEIAVRVSSWLCTQEGAMPDFTPIRYMIYPPVEKDENI
jgi:fructokinase